MVKLGSNVIRILITGADGFLGRNLRLYLAERSNIQVVLITRNDSPAKLLSLLREVDLVFHLAGVNRPDNLSEFHLGNVELTRQLAKAVANVASESGRRVPVVYTSSIQANLDSPYGSSKREAEQVLFQLAEQHSVPIYVARLPNVFGKWCRPNYNSVVATFCHNIARGYPINIHEPDAVLTLVYVDDVLAKFMAIIDRQMPLPQPGEFIELPTCYQITVGELAHQLMNFRQSRETLKIGRVGFGLTRALYATYVSYLPTELFAYDVPEYTDVRGSFVEMLKTTDSGQFSYFTAHPGVTRGGHYHHSKTEKFLVITGEALFRFRNMQTGQLLELKTSGDKAQIVETVPGWTHDITNIGQSEMVVMLWANEIFDRVRPDTFDSPL
jgi:UDP-2-acetamido-2,6-beta-L-arabino-hexul-4-ose reductase